MTSQVSNITSDKKHKILLGLSTLTGIDLQESFRYMSVKSESHARTSCEHEMLPLTLKYLHVPGTAWIRISYSYWKTIYHSVFQPAVILQEEEIHVTISYPLQHL